MRFGRRVKQLTVANPCRENWHAMGGGESARFCTVCNRSVHDLSVLTRREVAALIDRNQGKVCGRVTFDEHGRQVFARERRPIERLIQVSVLGASAMAMGSAAPSCDVKVRVVDATGAVVPHATVRISKTGGTETVSSGTSDDHGVFSGNIAPGIYSLAVEAGGFSTLRQGFTCKASEVISIEAPLQLGAMLGAVVEVVPGHHSLWEMFRSAFRRQ